MEKSQKITNANETKKLIPFRYKYLAKKHVALLL